MQIANLHQRQIVIFLNRIANPRQRSDQLLLSKYEGLNNAFLTQPL